MQLNRCRWLGAPCDLYFANYFDVASINDYDGTFYSGAEVLEECEITSF